MSGRSKMTMRGGEERDDVNPKVIELKGFKQIMEYDSLKVHISH